MRRRRVIGDDEFRRAWDDPDNRQLVRCEMNPYRRLLHQDDLDSCAMRAVWRALQYHRDDMGQKFTTSLYKFLHWEFRKEYRREARRRTRQRQVGRDVSDLPESKLPQCMRSRRLYRHKRHKRHVGLDPDDREQHELLGQVWEYMTLLPAKLRKVLRQYYFENRTAKEIGKLNGYSAETARQRLAAALDELRRVAAPGVGI